MVFWVVLVVLTIVAWGAARLIGFKPTFGSVAAVVGNILIWAPVVVWLGFMWVCFVAVLWAVIALVLHLLGFLPFVQHLLSERAWLVAFGVSACLSYLGYWYKERAPAKQT